MIRRSVLPTPEAAALTVAETVAAAIAEARSQRGAAHVSLAGGTTPRRAYALLAERLATPEEVDWWFGDERCVGPDDPESNYRLANETLFVPAGVPPKRVHRIRGEDPPEDAARAYEQELRTSLPPADAGLPALDVALLGLGEDGHTASLFPGDGALDVTDRLAVAVVAAKPPPNRITLTLPVLRAARLVLVLATGAGKADAVAQMVRGPDPATPASLLADANVELVVDESASP